MTPTMIVYPVPCETPEVWRTFEPCVERFFKTWRQFPPGCEVRVSVVLNTANRNDEVANKLEQWFLDCPGFDAIGIGYAGRGCDFGSQQLIAEFSDYFQINFTTRMYFHRAGWLTRLIEAREKYGPALYGLTGSHESGKLHLCTRGHCFDSADFREYPYRIKSRSQGVFMELGDGCLLDFFEQQLNRKAYLVTWDGVYEKADWFNIPNRFRNGDQSNVLVWDKHTEAWANADADEKERLTKLSEPPNEKPITCDS